MITLFSKNEIFEIRQLLNKDVNELNGLKKQRQKSFENGKENLDIKSRNNLKKQTSDYITYHEKVKSDL